jgi:hypothetical protein
MGAALIAATVNGALCPTFNEAGAGAGFDGTPCLPQLARVDANAKMEATNNLVGTRTNLEFPAQIASFKSSV